MYQIETTLFNLNDMKIEERRTIPMTEIFKEFLNWSEDKNILLKNKGLKIIGVKFEVENSKKFILCLISFLYSNKYQIIDADKLCLGHPDYILKNDSEEIFLEVKLNEDSLRMFQLKWFTENRERKNKLIHINCSNEIIIKKPSSNDSL